MKREKKFFQPEVKHLLFLVLSFLMSSMFYAQSRFQPGYIITGQEEKVKCLINNGDWKNNPDYIEYRQKNGETKRGTPASIREFRVYGFPKYISAKVKIDTSSMRTSELEYTGKPSFQEKTVFLKTLLEGKYSLYVYITEKYKRYFYRKNKGEIKPLVYKKYFVVTPDKEEKVAENKFYRQQLWNEFKNYGISKKEIEKLDYTTEDLVAFFNKINRRQKSQIDIYKKEYVPWHLHLKPAARRAKLAVADYYHHKIIDMGSRWTYKIGLEMEYILPYNNDRWGIFIEPAFHTFKSEQNDYKIDYKALELYAGTRYYIPLQKDLKIFINLAYCLNFDFNSRFYYRPNKYLEVKDGSNFSMATGLQYHKWIVEVRYNHKRNLLTLYNNWQTSFKTLDFSIGYSLF